MSYGFQSHEKKKHMITQINGENVGITCLFPEIKVDITFIEKVENKVEEVKEVVKEVEVVVEKKAKVAKPTAKKVKK